MNQWPFNVRVGKTVLLVFALCFIWMNVYISSSLRPTEVQLGDSAGIRRRDAQLLENSLIATPGFLAASKESSLQSDEIQHIAELIKEINDDQKVFNEEKFGECKNDFYVIVVQVHSRVEYLELLLQSLARLPEIENTLVIFSHDLYSPAMNDVIMGIDFVRFMQIFYPMSIQLHPTSFPGQSPNDCPRDMTPAVARSTGCKNANYPDIHGHYREARYTQTKHHWWWKANYVFGHLRVLRNYTGVISFIEEDHYVTPDFLWMLNLMEAAMVRNQCHGCSLISLGTYLKTWNIQSNNNKAVVTTWVSSKHNMGMAFNRTLWEKLKDCASTFCTYDDYNWDWSLHYVADVCLKTPLEVIYARAPRIFHIGDCGVHHKQKVCNPSSAASAITTALGNNRNLLFPDKLSVEARHWKKVRLKKGNGGWADKRDQLLCMAFTRINPNSSDVNIFQH